MSGFRNTPQARPGTTEFLPSFDEGVINTHDDLYLRGLNTKDVRKLFEESMQKSKYYDVYVRLSPKNKRSQPNPPIIDAKGNLRPGVSRSEILDMITQINEIIKRLEKKAAPKKSTLAGNT
jgi:hypothetical protein